MKTERLSRLRSAALLAASLWLGAQMPADAAVAKGGIRQLSAPAPAPRPLYVALACTRVGNRMVC